MHVAHARYREINAWYIYSTSSRVYIPGMMFGTAGDHFGFLHRRL